MRERLEAKQQINRDADFQRRMNAAQREINPGRAETDWMSDEFLQREAENRAQQDINPETVQNETVQPQMMTEQEFAQAVRDTDMWSIDKYFALHWGWPYDVAERGGSSHSRGSIRDIYQYTKRTYDRFKELNGGTAKPMMMSELNADGDVTGPYDQAAMVREFCDLIRQEGASWFTSFSMYQFRDRGRLGLEIEDPNNAQVGIAQPLLHTYKEIIHDDYFSPEMQGEVSLPVTLRWGGAEDADGLAIPLHFDRNPHFCEVVFEDDSNLMLELNGTWFYKSPKARTIDLMSAFYEKPLEGACDLPLRLFAPPAGGENDLNLEDGLMNSYTTITALPKVRIRFEPVETAR